MDHTIALIQRSHDGDEKAREQLVEENTGLVWCIVKRFFGRGTDSEDLFQIGSIGLLKAIDKFDLNYDVYSIYHMHEAKENQTLEEIVKYFISIVSKSIC